MAYKQIIIDGVDVSGCKNYSSSGKCYCSYNLMCGHEIISYNLCGSRPNCCYKRLKRKEQEHEELEQQFKIMKKDMLECTACRTTSTLKKQLDQLKAENEKLRIDYAELDKKAHEYLQENADYALANEKLKQALDEIEKYLKTQLDGFGNAVYSVDKSAITKISNIINKAKEQKQ